MLKSILNLTPFARTALATETIASDNHSVHIKKTLNSTHLSKSVSAKANTPLQQQILIKIEADYQLAENYFKRQFPRPLVQFTLRGKSAGTAHLQSNKLRFNPVLLAENPQIFTNEVVPHEISHLLSFQLFGKVKPHGKEWQTIMLSVFKVTPKTTHKLNIQSVSGQQFEYFCGCGSVMLTIRRHNRIVRGETQYRCRRCQQKLMTPPQ